GGGVRDEHVEEAVALAPAELGRGRRQVDVPAPGGVEGELLGPRPVSANVRDPARRLPSVPAPPAASWSARSSAAPSPAGRTRRAPKPAARSCRADPPRRRSAWP